MQDYIHKSLLLLQKKKKQSRGRILDALFKKAAPENTSQSVASFPSGRSAAKEMWSNLKSSQLNRENDSLCLM